jgi:uncharacterized membrane protein YphA (DoxX/SURF4 family)
MALTIPTGAERPQPQRTTSHTEPLVLTERREADSMSAMERTALAAGRLIFGGFSLLTGVQPRFGAALITGFLTGVTPRMHDYWNATDQMQRANDMVNFTKNLALIGGAAFAVATGDKWPWRLAS